MTLKYVFYFQLDGLGVMEPTQDKAAHNSVLFEQRWLISTTSAERRFTTNET